jgi:hypothetical protein
VQVNRALYGKAQLIELSPRGKGVDHGGKRNHAESRARRRRRRPGADLSALSTASLIEKILQEGKLLIEKEVVLARQEIKADLKSELAMVKGLAVALVAAICAVSCSSWRRCSPSRR